MQLLLNSKPFRRPSTLRQITLRALPLSFLTGALVQVARAQSRGAQTAAPSALLLLVSTLSIFAFFALLVGLFRPKTFAFLFHEKATRGRVCGTFGTVWFFLVVLAGPLAPKRVASAVAQNAPTTTMAQSAPSKDQSAVRLAENRAEAAEARAVRAEKAAALANAKSTELANRERAEEVAQKKRADKEAMAEIQASSRAESEAPSVSASASVPDSDLVTEEISDVSSADAWEPDGGQEAYRNPSTLAVLLAVQHVGDDSSPIVVKVGNNDFSTWGQTTVTVNYDLLSSLKKASVVAQLNYFYSFPSLESGHQKTIPLTAFRNAEGRAFDPDQYRLRRIFVESKTLEGRKTWDAHPS